LLKPLIVAQVRQELVFESCSVISFSNAESAGVAGVSVCAFAAEKKTANTKRNAMLFSKEEFKNVMVNDFNTSPGGRAEIKRERK
jgi:hypothetical protein